MINKNADQFIEMFPKWELAADYQFIERNVVCKNFLDAIAIINKITELAEKDDHHPDLHLTNYKNLKIVLTTHSEGGLTEKDFSLAAKIEYLLTE